MPTRLRDDGGGVMPTHVVESAELAIAPTHHDNRLASQSGAHKIAGIPHLAGSSDQLPGLAEYVKALEFGDARVGVPRRRNRGRLRQRRTVVVSG